MKKLIPLFLCTFAAFGQSSISVQDAFGNTVFKVDVDGRVTALDFLKNDGTSVGVPIEVILTMPLNLKDADGNDLLSVYSCPETASKICVSQNGIANDPKKDRIVTGDEFDSKLSILLNTLFSADADQVCADLGIPCPWLNEAP